MAQPFFPDIGKLNPPFDPEGRFGHGSERAREAFFSATFSLGRRCDGAMVGASEGAKPSPPPLHSWVQTSPPCFLYPSSFCAFPGPQLSNLEPEAD